MAISAARAAGRVLLECFGSATLDVQAKGRLDVVTRADRDSEHVVVNMLAAAYPSDVIVAEEGSPDRAGQGRVWHVDPLDGTYNFSRTIPYWCVSIALVDRGTPEVAVVYDPLREDLFESWRGGGTRVNGQPVRASGVQDPEEAAVQLTIDIAGDLIDESLADLQAVARRVRRVRHLGALALSLAYVGAGRLDAVVQRSAHSWDYAAGVLIARESGCAVSQLDGTPFDLRAGSALVAASRHLHDALLTCLQGDGSPACHP